MRLILCLVLAAVLAGCISQTVYVLPCETASGTNAVSSVEISKSTTNSTYKAVGGLIISMGIYSQKTISPDTSASFVP